MSGLAQYFHAAAWHGMFAVAAAEIEAGAFWLAVLQIGFADLVLSGDNAVVIALACRDLPPQQRRWGLIGGAGVAVLLRVVLVGALTWLLLLPYFKLIGGVALLFVAAKLLVPEADKDEIQAVAHLWRAIMIIAVADIVMSIDNVVAIAAIARGNLLLLAIGLGISIPLILAGAALVMALLDRFPVLVWAGTALLGWIAGDLIMADAAVLTKLTASLGGALVRQFAFAAPPAGAALAIVAGGLWRSLHLRRAERIAAQA